MMNLWIENGRKLRQDNLKKSLSLFGGVMGPAFKQMMRFSHRIVTSIFIAISFIHVSDMISVSLIVVRVLVGVVMVCIVETALVRSIFR